MSACVGAGCTHPDCTASHIPNEPVAKYDSNGRPIPFGDPRLGNRAERRAAARQARRAR